MCNNLYEYIYIYKNICVYMYISPGCTQNGITPEALGRVTLLYKVSRFRVWGLKGRSSFEEFLGIVARRPNLLHISEKKRSVQMGGLLEAPNSEPCRKPCGHYAGRPEPQKYVEQLPLGPLFRVLGCLFFLLLRSR